MPVCLSLLLFNAALALPLLPGMAFFMMYPSLRLCAHIVSVCSAATAQQCQLPMEEGSCGRYTLRWYFNSQVQACRPFIYSGCEGNDNRFLHLEQCEEVCLGDVKGIEPYNTLTLVYARLYLDLLICWSAGPHPLKTAR